MRIGSLVALVTCVATVATVAFAATQYTYDQLGRIQSATYDNGVQVIYNYDAAGNRTTITRKSSNTLGPVAYPCNMFAYGTQQATCNAIARAYSPQGLTLSISAVNGGSHGTPGHSGNNVTYTGSSNTYTGPDSFTFTIKDTNNRTSTATAFVSVAPGNPPIANNDSYQTSVGVALTNFNPTLNDIEPIQGNQIYINSYTSPTNGTLVYNQNNTFTYTPNTGFFGNDSFTYTDNDGAGQVSGSATVSIQVGSPPNAVADIVGTPLNTPVKFDPRVNDSDPNNAALFIVGTSKGPSNGSVAINSAATKLTYTPNGGFPQSGSNGLDTFTYTITDGPFTASATDTVCVQPALPVANNPTLLAKAFVPQQDDTTYVGGITVASGTIACNVMATLTQVNPGQHGWTWTDGQEIHWTSNQQLGVGTTDGYDTFTYVLTDPFGNTATGTVTVNVEVDCSCFR